MFSSGEKQAWAGGFSTLPDETDEDEIEDPRNYPPPPPLLHNTNYYFILFFCNILPPSYLELDLSNFKYEIVLIEQFSSLRPHSLRCAPYMVHV